MVEIAQNLFTTRRGSLLVGAAAAVLAGIILLAYLHQYRNSVNGAAAPVSVLVAKNLIQKGTPGDIIGTEQPVPGRLGPERTVAGRRSHRPGGAIGAGRRHGHLSRPAADCRLFRVCATRDPADEDLRL